jgi:hypothetical protein
MAEKVNNSRLTTPYSELEEKKYLYVNYFSKVSNHNIYNFFDGRFFPFATGVNDTGVSP